MKKIMYEDCNNNSYFLKNLFIQIQNFSVIELNWTASNLEFIPVDKGDFVDGIPNFEMEKILEFKRKVSEEHSISIMNNTLMELFDCIKTVYEGNFTAMIDDEKLSIKVFDGDIIEINGKMEDNIVF